MKEEKGNLRERMKKAKENRRKISEKVKEIEKRYPKKDVLTEGIIHRKEIKEREEEKKGSKRRDESTPQLRIIGDVNGKEPVRVVIEPTGQTATTTQKSEHEKQEGQKKEKIELGELPSLDENKFELNMKRFMKDVSITERLKKMGRGIAYAGLILAAGVIISSIIYVGIKANKMFKRDTSSVVYVETKETETKDKEENLGPLPTKVMDYTPTLREGKTNTGEEKGTGEMEKTENKELEQRYSLVKEGHKVILIDEVEKRSYELKLKEWDLKNIGNSITKKIEDKDGLMEKIYEEYGIPSPMNPIKIKERKVKPKN